MQGVSAQFPCTWEEVLDFRRDHVGPPEQVSMAFQGSVGKRKNDFHELFFQQAVRALVYMKNQLQFQLQQQQRNPYGVTSGANSINGIYTPQQNPYPQLPHSYGGSSNGGYRYGPADALLKKIYFLHKE